MLIFQFGYFSFAQMEEREDEEEGCYSNKWRKSINMK